LWGRLAVWWLVVTLRRMLALTLRRIMTLALWRVVALGRWRVRRLLIVATLLLGRILAMRRWVMALGRWWLSIALGRGRFYDIRPVSHMSLGL
jgi:hypothetical protein